MTTNELEKRIEAVERELARLNSKLEQVGASIPWWERIAGTFQDDAIYKKAMKLGGEYRRSLRPDTSGRTKK
jgi:hypothetical protein